MGSGQLKREKDYKDLKQYFFADIDECSQSAECGRYEWCVNTEGSFTCVCKEGFAVMGATCEGKARHHHLHART